MSGIQTPAMKSIEKGEIMPSYALDVANAQLEAEGIAPELAYVDPEINRHHRAIALGEVVSRSSRADRFMREIELASGQPLRQHMGPEWWPE